MIQVRFASIPRVYKDQYRISDSPYPHAHRWGFFLFNHTWRHAILSFSCLPSRPEGRAQWQHPQAPFRQTVRKRKKTKTKKNTEQKETKRNTNTQNKRKQNTSHCPWHSVSFVPFPLSFFHCLDSLSLVISRSQP